MFLHSSQITSHQAHRAAEARRSGPELCCLLVGEQNVVFVQLSGVDLRLDLVLEHRNGPLYCRVLIEADAVLLADDRENVLYVADADSLYDCHLPRVRSFATASSSLPEIVDLKKSLAIRSPPLMLRPQLASASVLRSRTPGH